ncbi:MAG: hypothetical protein JWN71_2497 [Xanthobacteraceae bacterium]|jgi:osmotically inducible lipoprotein OsmB|nr:hypothetical protein [Xanthobacteraceae bacterium]
MRKMFVIAATCTAILAGTAGANAQERTFTGAAIGAGTGAVIAGPPGAVVGGVVGAVVGGPRISHPRRYKSCWRDDRGYRHCRWR